MYTAGEFYSRKDLAAWMKRVWAQEIEEESAKLEQYRHMPVPPLAPMVQQPMPGVNTSPERVRRNSGPMAVVPPPPPVPVRNSGQHAVIAAPPAVAVAAKSTNGAHAGGELAWDDEELATNIYDGAPPDAEDAVVDDKPDLSKLELNSNGAPVPHHSVAQKLPTAPANDAGPALGFKGEMPEPAVRATARPPAGAIRSITCMPDGGSPPASAAPTETPSLAPRRRHATDRVVGRRRCGRGGDLRRGRGRRRLLQLAAGHALHRLGAGHQRPDPPRQQAPGRRRHAGDAQARAGSYVLTVQREGYVPWNEQVEVKPGDTTRRRITLDPLASGTGFTLVSEPAGAQALLDGRALEGVTPLKVQSVMPGKHKVEVKAATGSWQQEVTIEAGKMLEVRATIGVAAAKAPESGKSDKPVAVAAKTPDKTPTPPPVKTPPVVAAVQKTPEKSPALPSVAAKAKESEPPREKPKAPEKSAAAEPKKAKGPDLTLPDEEKPATKPPSPKRRPRSRRRRRRVATAGCASGRSRGPTSSSTARRPGCTRRRRISSSAPGPTASR